MHHLLSQQTPHLPISALLQSRWFWCPLKMFRWWIIRKPSGPGLHGEWEFNPQEPTSNKKSEGHVTFQNNCWEACHIQEPLAFLLETVGRGRKSRTGQTNPYAPWTQIVGNRTQARSPSAQPGQMLQRSFPHQGHNPQ